MRASLHVIYFTLLHRTSTLIVTTDIAFRFICSSPLSDECSFSHSDFFIAYFPLNRIALAEMFDLL